MDFELRQNGRAAMGFLAALAVASARLRPKLDAEGLADRLN